MYISPLRLAGMAAVLIVGVVGGALLGRVTAPSGAGGPGATTDPSPAPSADAGPTEASYRAARNAICLRYSGQLEPMKEQFGRLYDEGLTAAERDAIAATLTTFVGSAEAMVRELGDLEPPTSLVAKHAANVTNYENMNRLIRQLLARLAVDDLAGAELFDLATNPINEQVLQYEAEVVLTNCP